MKMLSYNRRRLKC